MYGSPRFDEQGREQKTLAWQHAREAMGAEEKSNARGWMRKEFGSKGWKDSHTRNGRQHAPKKDDAKLILRATKLNV